MIMISFISIVAVLEDIHLDVVFILRIHVTNRLLNINRNNNYFDKSRRNRKKINECIKTNSDKKCINILVVSFSLLKTYFMIEDTQTFVRTINH